jgi:hypothetical protein
MHHQLRPKTQQARWQPRLTASFLSGAAIQLEGCKDPPRPFERTTARVCGIHDPASKASGALTAASGTCEAASRGVLADQKLYRVNTLVIGPTPQSVEPNP